MRHVPLLKGILRKVSRAFFLTWSELKLKKKEYEIRGDFIGELIIFRVYKGNKIGQEF